MRCTETLALSSPSDTCLADHPRLSKKPLSSLKSCCDALSRKYG